MGKMTLKDEVYRKYRLGTNMSLKELKSFQKDKRSNKSKLNSGIIQKTIILVGLNKNKWTSRNVKTALELIKLRKKIKKKKAGKRIKEINLSEKTIDLMKLGINPNK